jgi:hypothetical protein
MDAEGREMRAPSANVAVLVWETATAGDQNACKIATFLGAEAGILRVASSCTLDAIRQLIPSGAAAVVRAEVLERIAGAVGGCAALATLFDCGTRAFVYGFKPIRSHAQMLGVLSAGGLLGVEPLPGNAQSFAVDGQYRDDNGPFSGLSVNGADPTRDASFIEGTPRSEQSVLIRVGRGAFLARAECNGSELSFSACNELADLDETFVPGARLSRWFSRLVPFVIFLRRALGKQLWHTQRADACLIIDDPFLKRRYGFLEYRELAASMEQHRFSTSIAFIPWNYRRSREQVAKRFRGTRPPLSLCVHGCDHTGREFATADSGVLHAKARLALERMEVHEKLSGVPFDKVMVFPQGLFSRQALGALDACGYIAAINTDLCPADAPEALKLHDVLDVAVNKFGGFPLFARHYPRDLAEFALDLFLGKPVLVVEHHGYFRSGLGELAAFVMQLNGLDPRLEWRSPEAICSEACLRRLTASDDIEVRAYTSRFRLTNRGTRPENLIVLRRWNEHRALPSVLLNGRSGAAERERDQLRIRLSLNPGETAEIHLLPAPAVEGAGPQWKPGTKYRAKVFVRRMLSEFRDDHVDTSRSLSLLLSRVRTLRSASKMFRSPSAALREDLQ